jgi:PTS system mannitol-specific IIC component
MTKFNELILDIAYSGWLPAVAAVIEPAKVMFLNNVMSYGILGPIGISQIRQLSKSIFFLLESNPGPAIGMLLAYLIRMRGRARRNAVSSLAIHALGGIQEVYFPYVLMKPQLLVALILGNMSGIWIFQYWNAGLVSIPSPASLFLVIGLAPPGDVFFVALGIAVSAAVSLAVSLVLFGSAKELDERKVENREHALIRRLEHVEKWQEISPMLNRSVIAEPVDRPAPAAAGGNRKITVCFACDAGLGSSAMGAAILRKKLRAVHLDDSVTVVHSSLDEIPEEADMIITHHYLLNRAKRSAPGRVYLSIGNYTDPAAYDTILENIRAIRPDL